MSHADHPYGRLFNRTDAQARQQARDDERFEESKVRFLLQRCGLGTRDASLRVRCRRDTGVANLRFAEFNEAYPTYPVLLGVDRLPGVTVHTDPRCFLPALLTRFQSAPFVKAFELFYEVNAPRACGRALGLIFKRKGFRHGLLIHTGLEALWYHGTGLTYQGGTRETPRLLHVHAFQTIVDAIWDGGHGWQPDE